MPKRYEECSIRERSWAGWSDQYVPEHQLPDGSWSAAFDSDTIDPKTGKPFQSSYSGSGDDGKERAIEWALGKWPDDKVQVVLFRAAEFYQPTRKRAGEVIWRNA